MSDMQDLSKEQRARADALEEAKNIIMGLAAVNVPADTMDLVNLATFILTGEDPWAHNVGVVQNFNTFSTPVVGETGEEMIEVPANPMPSCQEKDCVLRHPVDTPCQRATRL